MNNMTRTQIQVDTTPEFRHAVRVSALKSKLTMRQAVVRGLAKQFPELEELANKELTTD